MNNPQAFRKANIGLKKQVNEAVDDIYRSEYSDLSKKIFYLDHTAEVLENYRRLQENKIFDKILHDERMKKAFIKNEGRRVENLIGDFDRFRNYRYFQDTHG